MTPTIRCSSLPRLAVCPASYGLSRKAEATTGIIESGDAAIRGRDIHAQLAEIVNEDGIQGLQKASKNLTLDIAVRILAGRAWAAICDAGLQSADGATTESDVCHEALCLTGHADLVVYKQMENRYLVLDYKSGYASVDDSAENAQILGYAMCLYDHSRRNTHVYGKTVLSPLTVFGRIVPACGKMSAPVRVDAETEDLAYVQLGNIINATQVDTPRVCPGPHCVYCPAAGRTCDAFTSSFSEALTTTVPISEQLPAIPDESLVSAYEKLKQLATLETALTAEIKRRIMATGKPCGGYALKMRQGTTRLSGAGLSAACAKYNITSDDLEVAINVKDIGDLVAKRMGIKKIDGLSLVMTEFGHFAVQAEPATVLGPAKEEE